MFTLDSCHRGDSIPPFLTPTLLCQRLSEHYHLKKEKVTAAKGFLELGYLFKNQLKNESEHIFSFFAYFQSLLPEDQ